MDRFSGRDPDFQDDAPKHPMSKFVSSGTSLDSQQQSFGKIEIQASQREQRAHQQAKAMPPPQSLLPKAPIQSSTHAGSMHNSRPPGLHPPVWVGQPPKGIVLRVTKDDVLIDTVPLEKPMTVFGRAQSADVVLDHQSISRQHAAVCFQRMTGKWLVMDLGSVHGTFCDGKPVTKNQPAELTNGGQLRFGGSSRVYSLSLSQNAIGEAAAADSEAPPPITTVSSAREPDAEEVGPKMHGSPGRFANLVHESRVLNGQMAEGSTRKRQAPPPPDPGPHRRRPSYQKLKNGLYDNLPPPEQLPKPPSSS